MEAPHSLSMYVPPEVATSQASQSMHGRAMYVTPRRAMYALAAAARLVFVLVMGLLATWLLATGYES